MTPNTNTPAARHLPPMGGKEAGSLKSPQKSEPATYQAIDGQVFDERGRLQWPELCHGLLGVYERAAAAGDWWSPSARRLYLDLYDAMKAAGLIEQELAA